MRFLAFFAVTLICSCASGPKYKIPDELKPIAHGEMNNARSCIESLVGSSLSTDRLKYVQVYPVRGERKFSYGWGWREPSLGGIWVLGTCQGFNSDKSFIIKIGVAPDGSPDVSGDALKHEFGHLWLMHIYREPNHIAPYHKCFAGWTPPGSPSLSRDALSAVKSVVNRNDDSVTVIHYIEP